MGSTMIIENKINLVTSAKGVEFLPHYINDLVRNILKIFVSRFSSYTISNLSDL